MPIFDSRPSSGERYLCGCKGRPFTFQPSLVNDCLRRNLTRLRSTKAGPSWEVAQSPAGVGRLQASIHKWTFQLVPQAWTSSPPGLRGLGPPQRSEHHYSRMLYLKMGSINLSHSDWTLVSTSLLFFLLSIHKNTYLQEHADVLCDA